jgi:hypothetical protein
MQVENLLDHFPTEEDLIRQIVLISAAVWKHGLTKKMIDNWLSNFKGEILSLKEEKTIALWLLTNFVYYNEDEVKHLCKVLYKEFIHKELISGSITEVDNDNDYLNTLFSKFRFHYLGKPSESGGYILYLFRQVNDIPLRYFPKKFDVENDSADNIIFLDDVTLTADSTSQAYFFFQKVKTAGKKILLTLVATKDAIQTLNRLDVDVITTITLDEKSKCFSNNSAIFHNLEKYIDVCKKMVNHYGMKIEPKRPLGYNDGQFAFGFYYNSPDNTLPIFWSENNGWIPIVKRYDKVYNQKHYEYERYI